MSTSRGATSKADLKYVEKNILRIEADLRSNNKPTFQSLQSGRNRRAFQEEKSDVRCGICHRKGHSEKECKSPCWICNQVGHRNKDCPKKRNDRGRTPICGRSRNQSNSRQRDQSKKRRNSPHSKKNKSRKSNKNNRTKADSSNESGSTDNDRSSRSRSRSGSDNDEESPQRGEKSKRKSGRGSNNGNRRIVASHKTRRIGGRANSIPPLQLKIFRRASDKTPYNERLEVGVGDTGCTTSCIPLSVAKTHNLKVSKVDKDEPDMKS